MDEEILDFFADILDNDPQNKILHYIMHHEGGCGHEPDCNKCPFHTAQQNFKLPYCHDIVASICSIGRTEYVDPIDFITAITKAKEYIFIRALEKSMRNGKE